MSDDSTDAMNICNECGTDALAVEQALSEQAERIKQLEAENAALAADQCHGGYGTEWGHHRCKYQNRIAELEVALEGIARCAQHSPPRLALRVQQLVAEALAGRALPPVQSVSNGEAS